MLVTKVILTCIAVALMFGCSTEMQPAEATQHVVEMDKTDQTVGSDNAKGVPGVSTPVPGVPAPAPGVPAPAPAPAPANMSNKKNEQTRRLAVESMCTCTVVDEDDFEYGSEPPEDYRIYCDFLAQSAFSFDGLRGADNFRCYCPNTSYYLDEMDTKGKAECLAGKRNLSTVWDCSREGIKKVDPAVLGEDHFTTECSWSGKPYYSCNCSVTPRVWRIYFR